MTKISFDVDFNEDPEKILKDIQERAKAEVEKRESKEKTSAYLSTLHEKVNEETAGEMVRSVGQGLTRCYHRTLLHVRNRTTEMLTLQLLFIHPQVGIQVVLLL